MKIFLFLCLLGGIYASRCPAGCDCQSNNIIAICFGSVEGLSDFPDITRSPDIEEFFLFENQITTLPRLANSLTRLKILNLSNNELIKISRGSLPMSIEDAWMDNNQIKSISSRIFSNLPNIMRIYLRNNEISVIESGAFSNVPQLIELKLSNNDLTKMPRLSQAKKLQLLDLANNKLTKLDGSLLQLPSLTHLDLSGNALLSLASVRLPSLEQINLSRNNLVELEDSLLDSSDISMLNISENPLIRLPIKIFERLGHLKQFDVSNTEITSLPRIPSSMKLNELNLDGIRLRCDCEMTWMVSYFSQFSTHISALGQMKCAMPSKYAGTPITLFNPPECTIEPEDGPKTDPEKESLCQTWACNHGAKCIVENGKPKCQCYTAWTGEHCETLIIDTDLITDLPNSQSSRGSRIWVKNATTKEAKVVFARLQSEGAKLKLWIKRNNQFIPIESESLDDKATTHRYTDLIPNSEYQVCLETGLDDEDDGCAVFYTMRNEELEPAVPDVVTQPTHNIPESAKKQSTKSEVIGAVVASSILIIICGLIALVIRKRRVLAKHSKSELYSASGSGGEETNTWKYTTGNLTPNRSDNLTPESMQYNSYDDSPNIYAEIDQKYYPDAINHVTTRINQSPTPRNLALLNNFLYNQPNYEPNAHSTPQKTEPRSNRCPNMYAQEQPYSQSLKYQQRQKRPAAHFHSPNQLNNSNFY